MTECARGILGYSGLDGRGVFQREVGRDRRHGGAARLGGRVIESKTLKYEYDYAMLMICFRNPRHVRSRSTERGIQSVETFCSLCFEVFHRQLDMYYRVGLVV